MSTVKKIGGRQTENLHIEEINKKQTYIRNQQLRLLCIGGQEAKELYRRGWQQADIIDFNGLTAERLCVGGRRHIVVCIGIYSQTSCIYMGLAARRLLHKE